MAGSKQKRRPSGGIEQSSRHVVRNYADHAAEERPSPHPKWLLWPAVLLLAGVVGASAYLLALYVQVRQAPDPMSVKSFCNLGQSMNCVQVATSKYASLFGVPLALLAGEFYGLALLLVGLATAGRGPVRHWGSLLFVMMLLALPVSITMAIISFTQIQSFCIICCAVYTVNLILLLLLLFAYRRTLPELLGTGPKELLSWLKGSNRAVTISLVVLVLGITQLAWVPAILPPSGHSSSATTLPVISPSIPQQGLVIGSPHAATVIEEFTDYECPHCRLAHETLLQLVQRYPKQVRIRHYDFPLDQACNREVRSAFHQRACAAAYYARCAGEQHRFWDYAIQLFHEQKALEDSDLLRYGKGLGLDLKRLQSCAGAPSTRAAVLGDVEEGIRRHVRGTPTFFINGKKRIVGPRPLSFWEKDLGLAPKPVPSKAPPAKAGAAKAAAR